MSLSNFHDVSFPASLAFGASGGPERRTQVTQLASGSEVRNAIWAGARRRWDVGSAIASLDDLHGLITFFEARRGRLHGFRFRDFADDRSCPPQQVPRATDQVIGSGDGAQVAFQLVKAYGGVLRTIVKPVAGSVLVAVDGVEAAFTVDAGTGVVTLPAPPAAGAEVTAGYRFDCAARFDADRLEAVLEAFGAGRVVSVPLIELVG